MILECMLLVPISFLLLSSIIVVISLICSSFLSFVIMDDLYFYFF